MCEFVACLYSPQVRVFIESQLTSSSVIANEVILDCLRGHAAGRGSDSDSLTGFWFLSNSFVYLNPPGFPSGL